MLLLIITLVAYLLAAAFIVASIRRSNTPARSAEPESSGEDRLINVGFSIAVAAFIAHLSYVYGFSILDGRINFSLSSMTALVSAMLVLIFLAGCVVMPIRRLGVLVFPFTVCALLFSSIWSSPDNYLSNSSGYFSVHVLVAIMAYCLLTIAAIQALLYVYQERQIKSRTAPGMLLVLPPLQTMELLLFRLVAFGFLLLSITLVSGALFSQQIFGQPFEWKHHTILAILGWLVYSILLYKRYRHGLRGSQAVAWTVGGFILIQLGYFGTKIVAESLKL